MTRCIVHIGMHKTGSTSIQGSFDGFSDDRFLYASLGGAANHSLAIYSLFSDHPERHHLHRAGGRGSAAVRTYIARIQADLDASIAAAQGRTLIISGEDISVMQPPALALVRMREYFGTKFDEVHIAGYVRSPAAFMASAFQQRVKGGSISAFQPEKVYRNYTRSFGKLDEIFGRDKVHLWKFDPDRFPGGCVVRDFCARLDIALPAERIVRLNESVSRQVVSLLYTYRKFAGTLGAEIMRGPESQKLASALTGLGADKFRFSPELTRPILESHREDIEWMEARLGQSLQEDLDERRPGDVGSEADLLAPDARLADRLRGLLGEAAPAGVRGETPLEIASLMHILRQKYLPAQREREASGARTTAAELIRQARERRPDLLDGIPEDRAAALIQAAFRHISETLALAGEGVVNVGGLGSFRILQAERNGAAGPDAGTQIAFRRAQPGSPAGARARGTSAVPAGKKAAV